MLYFLPPATASLAERQSALDTAFVSVAPHVVTLDAGTAFVTLEGVVLSYARGTIITTLGPVANITIRNSTVSNGGGSGINVTGTGIVIEDSEVSGLAATAVEIRGGHHKTLERGDNLVKGNYIHTYARWFRTCEYCTVLDSSLQLGAHVTVTLVTSQNMVAPSCLHADSRAMAHASLWLWDCLTPSHR